MAKPPKRYGVFHNTYDRERGVTVEKLMSRHSSSNKADFEKNRLGRGYVVRPLRDEEMRRG